MPFLMELFLTSPQNYNKILQNISIRGALYLTVIHKILFTSPTNFNINNYLSFLSAWSKPSPAYVIKAILRFTV